MLTKLARRRQIFLFMPILIKKALHCCRAFFFVGYTYFSMASSVLVDTAW